MLPRCSSSGSNPSSSLSRARRRLLDSVATAGRTVSSESLALWICSCLLFGAGTIHLLETADHFTIDPWYGWVFVTIGAGQIASALTILFRRESRVLFVTAVGNLVVVGIWILSRTVGVPFGAASGVRYALGVADIAASLLELASVLVLSCLILRPSGPARVAFRIALSIGIAAIATSGVAVGASVHFVRQACSHFDPKYGPLGTVDGHSILPRDHPAVHLRAGQTRTVMSGLVVNCGSDEVVITGVEIVSEAGDAARVSSTSVAPIGNRFRASEVPVGSFARVAVPRTSDSPNWGVFSEVRAGRGGFYSINGLRIRYLYRSESLSQVFATNAAINVSGER